MNISVTKGHLTITALLVNIVSCHFVIKLCAEFGKLSLSMCVNHQCRAVVMNKFLAYFIDIFL